MTKDDILNYAIPSPSHRDALDVLVSQQATVEAIEAKVSQTKSEAARASLGSSRCLKALLLPVGFVLLAAVGLYREDATLAMWSLVAAMVLVPALSSMARHFDWKERFCQGTLEMLQPIAGTQACQDALQYLEADAPGVATWRDIALSERGQLYHFDIGIMRRLHGREEHRLKAERLLREKANQASDTERQRLNDEACRKVHGLMSLR